MWLKPHPRGIQYLTDQKGSDLCLSMRLQDSRSALEPKLTLSETEMFDEQIKHRTCATVTARGPK